MHIYTSQYYQFLAERSRRSARAIVPLLMSWVRPDSVVDVGCGVGSWLSVFAEFGVADILGIDGAHLAPSQLKFPESHFQSHDLTRPLELNRQFDLAVCLEVAEHLAGEHAETFIDSLVPLSPVIVFSAAVPYQGGEHHVNERWPGYWVEKFCSRGYVPIDCLRRQVWSDPEVCWWYAQNCLVFVRENGLAEYPLLEKELQNTWPGQLALVHPRAYLEAHWKVQVLRAALQLADVIPPGATLLIADRDCFGELGLEQSRHCLPFPAQDGWYAGPPVSDSAAIDQLHEMRGNGAEFLVFGWPAFWWLDHYTALVSHLRTHFPCLLENEQWIVFDLRGGEVPF